MFGDFKMCGITPPVLDVRQHESSGGIVYRFHAVIGSVASIEMLPVSSFNSLGKFRWEASAAESFDQEGARP